MNTLTDQELLRDYTGRRSEAAFAELVRRHVDFVYSAALRMVRDAHLAQDVAQGVFVALAQSAPQLTGRPILSGWLHRTTQNLAANTVRSDVRRRAREQEAAAMNELHEPDAVWEDIAPHLDNALGELSEADRDALLLRYFEGKSAREIAQTLGTSEDAAQKRVSRAVERLRELFSKRGAAIGSSGLVAVLSTNAVQAAPTGLISTISATAALSGAALHGAAALGATKAIAWTTLQKTLIVAAIAAGVGTGIYEARLRNEAQALSQQQGALTEQSRRLQQQRDEADKRLASLEQQNQTLRGEVAILSRLRSDMSRLQADSQELAGLRTAAAQKDAADAAFRAENPAANRDYSFARAFPAPAKTGEIPPKPDHLLPISEALMEKTNRLRQLFEQMPETKIPELKYLGDDGWLSIARIADVKTDAGIRRAISGLRNSARRSVANQISGALRKFIIANDGELPASVSDLKPYLIQPLDEAIYDRYKLLHSGKLAEVPENQRREMAVESAPPVDDNDSMRAQIGLHNVDLVPRKRPVAP